jgi:hypothetical protein
LVQIVDGLEIRDRLYIEDLFADAGFDFENQSNELERVDSQVFEEFHPPVQFFVIKILLADTDQYLLYG